jgi:hypothetical protein
MAMDTATATATAATDNGKLLGFIRLSLGILGRQSVCLAMTVEDERF